jgi:type VI secretion system secreted protein Hcp
MYVTPATLGDRPPADLDGTYFGESTRVATPARSVDIYISVEGTKQGKFKGETSMLKGPIGQSRVLKFSYGVVSPRDVFTGQASGKRQHKAIVITKEPGAATPQFFAALVSNEMLKSIVIQFFRRNTTGANELQQTITLTNATISDFRQYVGDDGRWLEDVAFVFQQIKLENIPSKTVAVDSWLASPA